MGKTPSFPLPPTVHSGRRACGATNINPPLLRASTDHVSHTEPRKSGTQIPYHATFSASCLLRSVQGSPWAFHSTLAIRPTDYRAPRIGGASTSLCLAITDNHPPPSTYVRAYGLIDVQLNHCGPARYRTGVQKLFRPDTTSVSVELLTLQRATKKEERRNFSPHDQCDPGIRHARVALVIVPLSY